MSKKTKQTELETGRAVRPDEACPRACTGSSAFLGKDGQREFGVESHVAGPSSAHLSLACPPRIQVRSYGEPFILLYPLGMYYS